MTAQLEIWYTDHGRRQQAAATTPTPPSPHDPRAVSALRPILRAWADHGHESLAEITRARSRPSLPADPVARPLAGTALRSLFSILKARKEVFSQPDAGHVVRREADQHPAAPRHRTSSATGSTRPIPPGHWPSRWSPFTGCSLDQVRTIMLTDVRDGRLTVDDRSIPLAGPVQVRLRAYLDHRARRFPRHANPYLLVNRRSAPRLDTGRQEISLAPPRAPAPATARGPHPSRGLRHRRRRPPVCDLFGLSVNAAMRYTLALEHPDLRRRHRAA